MEDNEEDEEEDDNYPMFPEYGDSATGEAKDEEAPPEDEEASPDDLHRAIDDIRRESESNIEMLKLDRLLKDHKKLLYPNCEDGQNKLGTTLELLQWKAENGITDKGFEKLLKIMKPKLPKDNELPESTYETKNALDALNDDG